jgi:hypothetical protein
MSTGQRIGDAFLWLEFDATKLGEERVVVLTAREKYHGHPVVAREIATREHVHNLRAFASSLEKALTPPSELKDGDGK